MSSSNDLIARAQQGDQQALGRLLKLYHNRLHIFINHRLGVKLRQEIEIDDVIQETHLRAFRSIRGFTSRGKDAFLRWLVGIAEHVIKDFARRFGARKRNGTGAHPFSLGVVFGGNGSTKDLLKLLAAKGSSPSKNARRHERFKRLEDALAALSPARREAIILVWIQGLPVKEAAMRMGKSPEAVSMLILRGLRNLRKLFGQTNSLRLPPRSILGRFEEGLPADGRGLAFDPGAPDSESSDNRRL